MFKMLVKFALVGLSGVGINMAVFLAVLQAGGDYLAAAAVAFFAAVSNNFFWNLRWTFKDRRNDKSIKLKYVSFVAISIANLGANLLFLRWLVTYLEFSYPMAQLTAIGAVSVLNFYLNYAITFQNKGTESTEHETGYHSNI